jgi:hypothetical protein
MPPRLHPEILTDVQRRLLRASSAPAGEWGAYLAGGSAAALYLGHRRSIDLDWFSPRTVPPTQLLASMKTIGTSVSVDQNTEGTFNGKIDGVKFSVFRYRYGLLLPTVAHDGCSIASVCDIAAMKLAAVAQRTTKRDYVDVHAFMKAGLSLETQVGAFHEKFPGSDARIAVRALGYFADVEKEPMPEMIAKTTWEHVKRDLTRALERFDLDRALKTRCRAVTLGRGGPSL